ncbi:DNA cytosine methyltransferase [Shouchella tritolerans]|uniref:DNA cytosine methyltransferase n=1 Tax=Shouchella tritolerans TaxID=2979466 RepID=UPI0021E90239|nr:DNA (cytosine-5-)-methyltransferase [Shouchella tritolerans]
MKSIELFAGIGGIALAAEWAGIETVAFCEREPFCQKILNKHWPDVPIFDDIKTLDKKALEERGIDVGAIELITGGFPCQPFSSAGKRLGKADDRDLWPEMFRIIQEIRPNWVVGENVANFVNMELERTVFDLESEGYTVQSFLIPAVSVDAKHNRARCFVVAHTESKRCSKEREYKSSRTEKWPAGSREIVADASIKRLQRGEKARNFSKEKQKAWKQFAGCGYERGAQWEPEPDVGRVAHGVPDRVDRIKGLGNAVVPQQIYPIFETIMKIERGEITC